MSNIGKVFGNEGWVQSMIDRSRGKTRPGEKARRGAADFAARREQALSEDPLLKKYKSSASDSKVPVKLKGLSGLLQRASALKNDPLVKKYGG